MRLLLITGAGGAGVTTLAAATAVVAARGGVPTALLGADGGALDATLGPPGGRPPSLTLAAPEPERLLGEDTPEVLAWLRTLLAWSGLDDTLASDLTLVPGARLIAALLDAVRQEAECVVVDLGAASEALPLLALLCSEPAGEDGGDSFGRTLARVAMPVITGLINVPRPGRPVREAGERAAGQMQRLRALLRDGERLSVRVVLPADARARRVEREARTALGLHGIGLDLLVCRDPSAAGGSSGPMRRAMPWTAETPRGSATLEVAGGALYTPASPLDLLAPAVTPRFELTEAGADLVVPVPERPPAELAVSRRGARLDLRVGAWRRTFRLPEHVAELRGRRAWHDGDAFRVRFER